MDILTFIKIINQTKESKKEVFIFGASKGGEILKDIFDNLSFTTAGFLDNDTKKWGGDINNIKIYSPSILLNKKGDALAFIASSYNEEIKVQLTEMGFIINKDFYDASNIVAWNMQEIIKEKIEFIESAEYVSILPALKGKPLLIITHNTAAIGGATYVALRICKMLCEVFKRRLYIVAMQGGSLAGEFSKYGTVININWQPLLHAEKENKIRKILEDIFKTGVECVISNTVISGIMFPILKDIGYKKIIGLVHELPTLISASNLSIHAKCMAEYSNYLVFASNFVKEKFEEAFLPLACKSVLRPQGVFIEPAILDIDVAKQNLRGNLGISAETKIVIGGGWGDLRKGVDVFFDIAKMLFSYGNESIHFVWVGGIEAEIKKWIEHDAHISNISSKIHFIEYSKDHLNIFRGADVFLMSSREDPFPSVVLESMYMGIPVVAFEKSGGIIEMLENECGVVVPYMSMEKAAEAITRLLTDEVFYDLLSDNSIRKVRNDYYTYESYVGDLLELAEEAPDKESIYE